MSKTMDKRTFFNSLAADWDGHREAEDAAARRTRFVSLAAEHNPSRILDVGSGTGVLVPELLAQCPGSTIVELDFAPEMIARNQTKHGQPNVAFMCTSIDQVPIDLQSFDAVLCFNVIPHLDSLDAGLGELVRLLRPGGRLSVGHLMGSAELNAFHAGMEGPICSDHLPPVEELTGLLERFGLRVQIAEERPDWYFLRTEKPVS